LFRQESRIHFLNIPNLFVLKSIAKPDYLDLQEQFL